MSLATLARKTKAKQRVRTRGNFILNMTGRGNVLGMNAKMSRGNCGGNLTKCAGKRAACCVGVGGESDCCQFKHGGRPAPQMGYGVYLNRKSKGAYHPGGGPQCCTKPNATSGKIVWKQPANIGAGEIVKNKKDTTLACYHQTNNNSSLGSAQCSSKTCSGKGTYIELYKYKMHVGVSVNDSYGYDSVGPVTFGNLCSGTLMGFGINTMEFEENDFGGYWFELSLQTNNINNPTQCSIQSITFVDSLDNSVKTYHTKNVSEFVDDGTRVIWRWDGGNPQDYWAGKLHHCLQVTIEVEKQKTYGLNSCTGCATNCDDPNNIFTVGFQDYDFWGYDNPGGLSTGDLVPNTIDNSGIRFMGYQTDIGSFPNQFFITFDSSGGVNTPPQSLFNSITFADCNDNSTRTYYTADATYHSQDPSGYIGPGAGGPGGLGCPTWRWDASTNSVLPGGGYSGYTRAEEEAYWAGVSGENLQVFINNTNPNFCCCKCCPVKKNICGCRATDLVRYTRINKSFGCQTTKTLPFNVSAADQIARKRSSALCPKYGISGFKKPQMLGSCSGR